MAKFEFYMKNAFFWGIYCWCSSKIAKIEIFCIFCSNCTKTVIFQFFSAFCKKKNSENGSYILKIISAFRKMCFWSSLTLHRLIRVVGPPQCWQAFPDISLIRVKLNCSCHRSRLAYSNTFEISRNIPPKYPKNTCKVWWIWLKSTRCYKHRSDTHN